MRTGCCTTSTLRILFDDTQLLRQAVSGPHCTPASDTRGFIEVRRRAGLEHRELREGRRSSGEAAVIARGGATLSLQQTVVLGLAFLASCLYI